MQCLRIVLLLWFILYGSEPIIAQPGEKRIQYPKSLKNSFFGLSLGAIHYDFSAEQLQPGFTVSSVTVPPVAPRFVLYGYRFNKHFSAQVTYMRPVKWVVYKSINGDQLNRTVWMNVGGLTVSGYLPLGNKFSLAAEAGLGLITRRGFSVNNTPAIKNTVYGTGLFGGGLQYHVNRKWDLQLTAAWSPANEKEKQPATRYISAGFNYHLRGLSPEKVATVIRNGAYFPRQLLQVGYTTNALGYGVNDLFSKTVPIFWGGAAHLRSGVTVNYQRNLFHTEKVFALDWGAGFGAWKSRRLGDRFFTFSLYPVLRFTAFRSKQTDLFFEYTAAGPTFISKTLIDNERTGRRFTFYDAMGMGIFTGKKKQLNAGIRIAHFSNGNIFPNNNGVKVPLTFSLGYAWP